MLEVDYIELCPEQTELVGGGGGNYIGSGSRTEEVQDSERNGGLYGSGG